MPEREFRIPVGEGRELQVLEAGDPRGRAVIVHHGTPGSRLLWAGWVDDARARGIRLIGFDRAGYGGSTPEPGRDVAAAAAACRAIADALEIERFATWGLSGGGPHALACAALLPGRVVAAATVAGVAPHDAVGLDFLAGMGPENVEEFNLAAQGRAALEPFVAAAAAAFLATDAQGLAAAFGGLVSDPDRAALDGPATDYLWRCIDQGVRGGHAGWTDDDLAFATRPWGFELGTISVPVGIWQGDQDLMVPGAHGRWMAAAIPTSELSFLTGEGHLSLALRGIPAVHSWLMARFPA